MTWDFCVKTTSELSPGEIQELCHLFFDVFHKSIPADVFVRKFSQTHSGNSVHSLMLLDGKLVGAFSAIQARFQFHGREVNFAYTADLMIHPNHRNSIRRYMELAENLYRRLSEEGAAFVFCCLRDKIATFHIQASKWRAIGKIHYYVAPLRVPWMGPLSGVVRGGLGLWNWLRPAAKGPRDAAFPIEKMNDVAFAEYRYGIFPIDYKRVSLSGGGTAVYITSTYYPIEGVPSWLQFGLLIDVFPLTGDHLDEAVRAIRRKEPQLNALAYQGSLPFQSRRMLLVPAKYEKQSWTFAGRILRPDLVDDRVFDIASWNINLSNGDLV